MTDILQSLCYLITDNVKEVTSRGNEIRVDPLDEHENALYFKLKCSFSEFMAFCTTPPIVENKYKDYIERLIAELKKQEINELMSIFYMKKVLEQPLEKDIIDIIIELNDCIFVNGDVCSLAYEIAEIIKKDDFALSERIIKEGIAIAKMQKKVLGMKTGYERLIQLYKNE